MGAKRRLRSSGVPDRGGYEALARAIRGKSGLAGRGRGGRRRSAWGPAEFKQFIRWIRKIVIQTRRLLDNVESALWDMETDPDRIRAMLPQLAALAQRGRNRQRRSQAVPPPAAEAGVDRIEISRESRGVVVRMHRGDAMDEVRLTSRPAELFKILCTRTAAAGDDAGGWHSRKSVLEAMRRPGVPVVTDHALSTIIWRLRQQLNAQSELGGDLIEVDPALGLRLRISSRGN